MLFAIHGAMVADGIDEADAYMLQRIRNAIGIDTPLVVTFDLHGNISEALVEVADVLVGYDTLPHIDMAERGREATRISSPVAQWRSAATQGVPQIADADGTADAGHRV